MRLVSKAVRGPYVVKNYSYNLGVGVRYLELLDSKPPYKMVANITVNPLASAHVLDASDNPDATAALLAQAWPLAEALRDLVMLIGPANVPAWLYDKAYTALEAAQVDLSEIADPADADSRNLNAALDGGL
jgi:hypothetical protein